VTVCASVYTSAIDLKIKHDRSQGNHLGDNKQQKAYINLDLNVHIDNQSMFWNSQLNQTEQYPQAGYSKHLLSSHLEHSHLNSGIKYL